MGVIRGHNTDYRQADTINGIMSPDYPRSLNTKSVKCMWIIRRHNTDYDKQKLSGRMIA